MHEFGIGKDGMFVRSSRSKAFEEFDRSLHFVLQVFANTNFGAEVHAHGCGV